MTRSLAVESNTGVVGQLRRTVDAASRRVHSPRRQAARYSETMARDKVDVAKRVVDAYNRRDVDGLFAELATPDFEWYPGHGRAQTHEPDDKWAGARTRS